MSSRVRELMKQVELQQIAEYVYQEIGFNHYTHERFDADDRKDIESSLAEILDHLMRKTWVLAGGDPERFSYPVKMTQEIEEIPEPGEKEITQMASFTKVRDRGKKSVETGEMPPPPRADRTITDSMLAALSDGCKVRFTKVGFEVEVSVEGVLHPKQLTCIEDLAESFLALTQRARKEYKRRPDDDDEEGEY